MAFFENTAYVLVKKNQFRIRHLESNTEATFDAQPPFTTTRLLVGEFRVAEALLKRALREVLKSNLLSLGPRVVIQPLEMVEGGLSEIEERILREVAMGRAPRRLSFGLGRSSETPMSGRNSKGRGVRFLKRAIGAVVMLAALTVCAATSAYVVNVAPSKCTQGLYQQPGGGPFSVFLFCDDAAGVNIGVVNTSGAAGPGRIDLGPLKQWDKWQVNDRFWQDHAWATDITSFAWSPDLKALYVGTSGIYGTGALYKLDLVNRTFQALVPQPDWRLDPKYGHSTTVLDIDPKTGDVSIEFATFDDTSKRTDVRRLKVK